MNYLSKNSFVVFQGSFINNNFLLNKANLLLPSQIFAEKVAGYLNLEGRVRYTEKAISAFKHIFSDVSILMSLFISRKFFLISNFSILSVFSKVMIFFSNLLFYDSVYNFSFDILLNKLYNLSSFYLHDILNLKFLSNYFYFLNTNKIFNTIFSRYINNFYTTDSFCENSKTLTLCSLNIVNYNFAEKINNS